MHGANAATHQLILIKIMHTSLWVKKRKEKKDWVDLFDYQKAQPHPRLVASTTKVTKSNLSIWIPDKLPGETDVVLGHFWP